MRHSIAIILIAGGLFLPLASRAAEPGQAVAAGALGNLDWKNGAATIFPRVESPTAVLDGKLYLFGGFTEDLGASSQVDVYDPATDTWSRRKDMPTGVTHLNPAVDGNTLFLAGGFKGRHPGPVTNEVWQYDIAADSWSPGPPLPEPRAGGGLAVLDHKLHYFGGYKSDRDTGGAEHWSLDLAPGKSVAAVWQREADLPDPRGHVSAAVLDGKIYALGGDHGHDVTQIDVSSCHVFEPRTNQWSAIASLPDGRSHFESSTIIYRGGILLVGGRSNSPEPARGVLADLLFYDPRANQWQLLGTIPEKVLAPSAAIVGNRLIVTGGGLNNPRPLTASTHVATIPADK